MAKHDKTLDQIQRLNAGLHWTKVEKLLKSYGAEVYEGSGSTVTFVVDEVKLTVDRPHPRKECGKGLVKRVREYLRTIGKLSGSEKDEEERPR
jgi:predicted RNA binding protein YcfA (HicA-like mRNA interferase family)